MQGDRRSVEASPSPASAAETPEMQDVPSLQPPGRVVFSESVCRDVSLQQASAHPLATQPRQLLSVDGEGSEDGEGGEEKDEAGSFEGGSSSTGARQGVHTPPPPATAPAPTFDSAYYTALHKGMPVGGEDGGINRTAEENSVRRPTPFPVTSASSLRDWSTSVRLGFPQSRMENVALAELAARPLLEAQEAAREAHWSAICKGMTLLASTSPRSMAQLHHAVVHHGVPAHLRTVLWLTLTGVAQKIDENEYFCRSLLQRNGYVTGRDAAVMEADLDRTFPGHPYFSNADVGIYKLKNVLHALYWRNPLLCYCQSFNCLAGILLLLFDDEERSFWMMCYILEELLPNDFYNEFLIGAKVDQHVLDLLVRERLPKLHHHLVHVGFDVAALVPSWMMSLFIHVFPTASVLCIWDYILIEKGKAKVGRSAAHLEIVLAVLKLCEGELLSLHEETEIMVGLKSFCQTLFDTTRLLQLVRNTDSICHVDEGTALQLRLRVKSQVVEETQALAARRARRKEQQRIDAMVLAKDCVVEEEHAATPTHATSEGISVSSPEPSHSASGVGGLAERMESEGRRSVELQEVRPHAEVSMK